jgi:hypothetical protein
MSTRDITAIKEGKVRQGYDDFVESNDGTLNVPDFQRAAAYLEIDVSVLEQWYVEGWNLALRTEQDMGKVLFLLAELRACLDDANMKGHEWYGTDFESPLNLVNKVIKALEEERTNAMG